MVGGPLHQFLSIARLRDVSIDCSLERRQGSAASVLDAHGGKCQKGDG